MKKKNKYFLKTTTVVVIAIVIIMILFLFWARIYLLINMLLGNDILVKVSIDKKNLFMLHNQTENVNIKTDIVTNPFCTVYCNYSLNDISYLEQIEGGNFSLKTIKPFTKSFPIISPKFGEGQKLYTFDIECISKKTFLCDTKEEVSSRTILITLNYGLSLEEEETKNYSKWRLEDFILRVFNIQKNTDLIKNAAEGLGYEDREYINNKTDYLFSQLKEFNKSIEESRKIWESEDFDKLSYHINSLEDQNSACNKTFTELKIESRARIDNSNYQLDRLFDIMKNLTYISEQNMTNGSAQKTSELIQDYNLLVTKFSNLSVYEKSAQIDEIAKRIEVLENEMSIEPAIEKGYFSPVQIVQKNISKISLNLSENRMVPELTPPIKVCCSFGKCLPCCNESCYMDKSKYPVLFIHGHNFNKELSAEYNLYTFKEMQNALESYGYVDSGALFVSYEENTTGIWGKTNSPVTITSSYYFDTLKDSAGETILESDQDSIDTYAIRLNEIIGSVKDITGREKVIVVAHSMGGLVLRRYVQLFGNSSIDRMILVMTPNHGISGSIQSYCSIFGSELECKDMGEHSMFMSKVNNNPNPGVPVYNIIGIGCSMDGEEGDGIVTNSSAYLDFAENYYINGTCNGLTFTYLHTEINHPDKHPEMVRLLKNLIEK